jgi:hypothetical protein
MTFLTSSDVESATHFKEAINEAQACLNSLKYSANGDMMDKFVLVHTLPRTIDEGTRVHALTMGSVWFRLEAARTIIKNCREGHPVPPPKKLILYILERILWWID